MTDAVSSIAGSALDSASKSSQVLTTDEFMQIMITELTNQDPFEPMKNEQLLNQMATLQQMENSRMMTNSFESLMDRYDTVLSREEISTAGRMIGQVVSGTTAAGAPAYGKVVALNITDAGVSLELDTGAQVDFNDITRVGGSHSRDIVNQLVYGSAPDGRNIVGVVQSMDIDQEQVILSVLTRDNTGAEEIVQLPLDQAALLNSDSASSLLGRYVEGYVPDNQDVVKVSGFVQSYRLTENNDVVLQLLDNDTTHDLPLFSMTRITNINNA